jgi:hypothetical protein
MLCVNHTDGEIEDYQFKSMKKAEPFLTLP